MARVPQYWPCALFWLSGMARRRWQLRVESTTWPRGPRMASTGQLRSVVRASGFPYSGRSMRMRGEIYVLGDFCRIRR